MQLSRSQSYAGNPPALYPQLQGCAGVAHLRATRSALLLWAGAIAFACLSQEARAAAVVSLATTAVGQQAQPLSVTVTLGASGIAMTMSSINLDMVLGRYA